VTTCQVCQHHHSTGKTRGPVRGTFISKAAGDGRRIGLYDRLGSDTLAVPTRRTADRRHTSRPPRLTNWLAMTLRWISLVPSPTIISGASRKYRSTSNSWGRHRLGSSHETHLTCCHLSPPLGGTSVLETLGGERVVQSGGDRGASDVQCDRSAALCCVMSRVGSSFRGRPSKCGCRGQPGCGRPAP
jgi:hypothetical protein